MKVITDEQPRWTVRQAAPGRRAVTSPSRARGWRGAPSQRAGFRLAQTFAEIDDMFSAATKSNATPAT